MQINLSGEKIQNICEVAFSNIKSLENKIYTCEQWLALHEGIKSESEIRRHKIQLDDLKSQLEKAHDVHNMFLEFRDQAIQSGELNS